MNIHRRGSLIQFMIMPSLVMCMHSILSVYSIEGGKKLLSCLFSILIGCASHRLNLAMQRLWKKEKDPYYGGSDY